MVLKLYGFPMSTCTQRALLALHEKGVPYEMVEVQLHKGETKTPEFLAIQPFGQVPYIDEDGFILYESRAIARYIAEKYASQGTPNLLPTADLKARALFEQAASIETSDFDQYASHIVMEGLFKPMMGGTTDKAKVQDITSTLSKKLDVYEQILSKQRYLSGDNITLADLFHVPYGVLLKRAGADVLDGRPNVKRWFDDMTSRPSWQAIKSGSAA
ncbi:glutathione S-transferase [Ephemerocybe angulata]|uniref:glutathione transferase n=1 Tax=Ephemerocybe angulata TaxID=980116 RepID=A0A8H6HYN7_9AGAR|nr:glutathione S-transferase [Tulosesus angulatus]